MNGYGLPGNNLIYNNRYGSLMSAQQPQGQQQQQSPMDMLSNAKQGYDTYNTLSGRPSLFSQLLGSGSGAQGSAASAWNAGDYGAFSPTFGGVGAGAGAGAAGSGAGAAWGAGDFAAFSPTFTGAGAAGSGGASAGAGAGAGGSSLLGFLGPIGVLGLAAYLGYQHGSAKGDEYNALQKEPGFVASTDFLAQNPGAITSEGVAGDQPIPDAPLGGYGGTTVWNPDTRRYEINGMSFPEYDAWYNQTYNRFPGD